MKLQAVKGEYTLQYWTATCPECRMVNRMDSTRSFKPQILDLLRGDGNPGRIKTPATCEHFQQLSEPGHASDFIFKVLKGEIKEAPKKSSLYDFEELIA